MVAIHLIKIFSIATLVTFLVSSVEPAKSPKSPKCPMKQTSFKTSTDDKKFVVLLDKAVKEDYFQMMEDCYDTKVEHIKELKGINKKSLSTNTIRDFSVDGTNMHGFTMKMPNALAEEMKKMKGVKMVEKEIKYTTQYALPSSITRRTVAKTNEENLDRIDQAKRPLDGKFIFPDSAGKGVNIFVVDTGIRTTHNEFGGRAKFGGSFCDGCNDDDENGHGTQVASIAAGKTFGVARAANLIAVRVLDAKGTGSNDFVINGLSFVLDQHKSGKSKNTVVNMSLGGGFSAAVNSAVKDLTDAGVHVAVAAGNEGEDACKSSPASELSAVTVGATEKDNETVTDFSNIGKCLDIFAPGRDIGGAGIKSDDDIQIFSGTSQATPHVAGTLALMIAKDGNKPPADLAKDLIDLSTKGVVKGLKDGSPDSFLRTPEP